MNWLKRLLGIHIHNWDKWELYKNGQFQWRMCKTCGYIETEWL